MQIKTFTCVVLIVAAASLAACTTTKPVAAKPVATDTQGPGAARSDAQAESSTEASQYLATVDHTLALARKGEYGRLERGSEEKLKAARDRIADLLEGHASASELRPDDLIALQNAEAAIKSIIDNQDKDRMVCAREAGLGTRITRTECLTVGEREARGRGAMEVTEKVQREGCIPTVDNPCGGG